MHTYNEILPSHKKKKRNLAMCDNIDGSRGYYVKWNKSDSEKQIPYDFTYMWNLRNKTNQQIKQKHTYKEKKLVVTSGEEFWMKDTNYQL